MLVIIGIAMIVGILLDILLNGFSGFHVILFFNGIIVIVVGSGLHKKIVNRMKFLKPNLASVVFSVFFIIVLILFFVLGATIFPSREIYVQKVINKSITLHSQGDTIAAFKLLQKLSLEQPLDVSADIKIGMNFYKQKRYEEAIKKFAALVEKQPFCIEARYNLGRSRMALEDWQGALNDLKSIALFEPHHGPTLEALGDAYWEINDTARSIYYYKLAEREAPKTYSAYIKLGFAFLKTNFPQHALLEFEKARVKATTENEKKMITDIINEAKKELMPGSTEAQ